MKRLKELLKKVGEAKQVGTLYHYTNFRGALGILRNDEFLVSYMAYVRGGKIVYGVSFTRDKNFTRKSRSIRGVGIRFVVDGDKLSNRYKVVPYGDETGNYGDESETIVLFDKRGKSVKSASKYIKEMQINKVKYDDEKEYDIALVDAVEEIKVLAKKRKIKFVWY